MSPYRTTSMERLGAVMIEYDVERIEFVEKGWTDDHSFLQFDVRGKVVELPRHQTFGVIFQMHLMDDLRVRARREGIHGVTNMNKAHLCQALETVYLNRVYEQLEPEE